MSFWQGFKIGALSALIYNAWKNPGSCACCAVLLVVIALLLGIFLVAFVMATWKFILVGVALWVAVLVARDIRRRKQ